jgi:hypothetical protein
MKLLAHWGVQVIQFDWTQPDTDLTLEQMFFGRI